MPLKAVYEMIHHLFIRLQELLSPKKPLDIQQLPDVLSLKKPLDMQQLPYVLSPKKPFDIQQLPDEIQEHILQKLPIGDRFRLKLVCKAWNHWLNRGYMPQPQEAPWQILPASKGSGIVRFRSLFENRTYSFKSPTIDGYTGVGWCMGSSGGWLLMGYERKLMGPLLWNPITGDVRQLPRLPAPYPLTDVKKVRVFSTGSADCIVALVLKHEEIVICTPAEQGWTKFLGERVGVLELRDIVYHTGEGKLYVLAVGEERVKNLPVTSEIHLNGSSVRFHLLFVRLPGSHPVFASKRTIAMHLVRSSITQEVLILVASFGIAVSHLDKSRYLRTAHFDTFYLPDTDGEVVEAVGGLGMDQAAVFLGTSGSISVRIADWVEPGCIYFTRQDPWDYVDPGDSNVSWCRSFHLLAEDGVFSLKYKTMRRHVSYLAHDPKFILGWYTPVTRHVSGCYPDCG